MFVHHYPRGIDTLICIHIVSLYKDIQYDDGTPHLHTDQWPDGISCGFVAEDVHVLTLVLFRISVSPVCVCVAMGTSDEAFE
jgi:hypothetical protein